MSEYRNTIIIIDDSEYKQEDIIDSIQRFNDDCTFQPFSDYCSAMCALTGQNPDYKKITDKLKTDPDDCILFLDMMFPLRENEPIEKDMGLSVLQELKRKGIIIKTVMISSTELDLKEIQSEYPFVTDHIQYNPSIYLTPQFEEVCKK